MTRQARATLATPPTPAVESIREAVACFLAERDLAPSSQRVYALALGRLSDQLAPNTPPGEVTPRTLAKFMTSSYPLAPASWNRVVATLGSFFAYTTRQGWTATSPAAALERHRLTVDRDAHARARAIDEPELLAFLTASHPLGEKTLWWMLYETAARAGEILALDVADLDLPRRRAVVLGKSGRAELVGWETKTARLLPRLLHNRRSGPLFLANIAPAPARQPALADIDPAPTTPLPIDPPRRVGSPAPDPHVQEPPHQPPQPRHLRQTNLRRRSRRDRGPRPRAPATLNRRTPRQRRGAVREPPTVFPALPCQRFTDALTTASA